MSGMTLLECAKKINEVLPLVIKGLSQQQMNEFYKDKITMPQFLVLNFLNLQGDSRMTDMARFMQVSTAAMTGIIERLVRYGWALRVFDARDRRIIKVKLTVKGANLVRRLNQHRRQMIIKIFGKISEGERQAYLRILTKIKDILADENSEIK